MAQLRAATLVAFAAVLAAAFLVAGAHAAALRIDSAEHPASTGPSHPMPSVGYPAPMQTSDGDDDGDSSAAQNDDDDDDDGFVHVSLAEVVELLVGGKHPVPAAKAPALIERQDAVNGTDAQDEASRQEYLQLKKKKEARRAQKQEEASKQAATKADGQPQSANNYLDNPDVYYDPAESYPRTHPAEESRQDSDVIPQKSALGQVSRRWDVKFSQLKAQQKIARIQERRLKHIEKKSENKRKRVLESHGKQLYHRQRRLKLQAQAAQRRAYMAKLRYDNGMHNSEYLQQLLEKEMMNDSGKRDDIALQNIRVQEENSKQAAAKQLLLQQREAQNAGNWTTMAQNAEDEYNDNQKAVEDERAGYQKMVEDHEYQASKLLQQQLEQKRELKEQQAEEFKDAQKKDEDSKLAENAAKKQQLMSEAQQKQQRAQQLTMELDRTRVKEMQQKNDMDREETQKLIKNEELAKKRMDFEGKRAHEEAKRKFTEKEDRHKKKVEEQDKRKAVIKAKEELSLARSEFQQKAAEQVAVMKRNLQVAQQHATEASNELKSIENQNVRDEVREALARNQEKVAKLKYEQALHDMSTAAMISHRAQYMAMEAKADLQKAQEKFVAARISDKEELTKFESKQELEKSKRDEALRVAENIESDARRRLKETEKEKQIKEGTYVPPVKKSSWAGDRYTDKVIQDYVDRHIRDEKRDQLIRGTLKDVIDWQAQKRNQTTTHADSADVTHGNVNQNQGPNRIHIQNNNALHMSKPLGAQWSMYDPFTGQLIPQDKPSNDTDPNDPLNAKLDRPVSKSVIRTSIKGEKPDVTHQKQTKAFLQRFAEARSSDDPDAPAPELEEQSSPSPSDSANADDELPPTTV